MLKVNKNKAQRLYNEGKTIKVYPCKANMNYIFDLGMILNKDSLVKADCMELDFNKICNQFSYYNCNYELGYTLKYYVMD